MSQTSEYTSQSAAAASAETSYTKSTTFHTITVTIRVIQNFSIQSYLPKPTFKDLKLWPCKSMKNLEIKNFTSYVGPLSSSIKYMASDKASKYYQNFTLQTDFLSKTFWQIRHLAQHRKLPPHHTHTTTVLRPFFRNHPRQPVPEESFFWTLWC